jgi:ferredoxin--NADP+ reductase
MAYVITHLCTRQGDCVQICPMGCIVPGPGDKAEWPSFYIDPDGCIDCGVCRPSCTPGAIFSEGDVPEEYAADIELNRRYFTEGPGYRDFDLEQERVASG